MPCRAGILIACSRNKPQSCRARGGGTSHEAWRKNDRDADYIDAAWRRIADGAAPHVALADLPDTPGAEIHPSVAPLAGETVVRKHFPNAFRETPLLGHLRALGTKVLWEGAQDVVFKKV